MDGPVALRQKLAPSRPSQGVAQRIIEVIRSGDLARGDRLPGERSLAAQLGVSRTTVRDAIKALRDAGVLSVKPGPGGGTFVAADYIPPDVLDEVSDVGFDEVPSLLEARRLLEPRVAQLAALYGSPEDFRRLATTIEAQREARGDPVRFIEQDIRFHILLAQATGNPMIMAFTEALFKRLAPIMRKLVMEGPPPGPDESIEMSERTLAAVRTGIPEDVETVMLEHLGRLETLWEAQSGVPLVRRAPMFLRS